MNLNKTLIEALSPLCGQVWPDVCTARPLPDEYIVFVYEDEAPEVYAGDLDEDGTAWIQVHYFVRGNAQAMKPRLRAALRGAGLTVTDTAALTEDETGYTHVIIYAYDVGFD